jgi:ribose transport system substrate-binding protein
MIMTVKRDLQLVLGLFVAIGLFMGIQGTNLSAGGKSDAQGAGGTKQYKVGYASLTEDNDFGVVTRESVEKYAKQYGWQLVVTNNNYDGATAIQNADMMITQKVDGFINFQVDAGVAPVVAEMVQKAKIPMIAIDCPHPNTPFFGANNKEAGLILGRALGDKANAAWGGKVDLIILCGAPGSGEVVDLRMKNIVNGIIEKIPAAASVQVLDLDGKSGIETSQRVIADTLSANPNKHNILIGGLNDQSALGAFNAVQAANRQNDVFLGSHGCDAPAKNNLLNNPANFWIGSVAYFPERYGEYVVPLMLAMMEGKTIPANSHPDHLFIDKSNVGQYYSK